VKLPGPRVWLTLLSLSAVLLAAIVDTDRVSPGPVSAVHGALADLDGGQSCSKCHGGWFSTMTEACLDCHAPIEEQLAQSRGLHGTLERSLATSCGSCHGEHHGEVFPIVNSRSFAFAGVADPKAFDHLKVGFEMNGRHLEIGCADCHENADKVVLAEGQRRYLGLDRDCASCHEDVHEGRMRFACVQCHGQTTWDELHSFGHERVLPLVGGHGDVGCRTCHADGDAHALEILGESQKPPRARECAECHVSPHRVKFARQAAKLADLPLGAGCVTCHLAEHTNFAEGSLAVTPEQHALSGFALDLPHDKVACEACHKPELDGFRARFPGRTSEACSACHADVHGGQFAEGPFARQECTACHDKERFEPHAFTVEKHALASLPLTGKHLEAACNDCHEAPAPEAPRTFHGTVSRCELCHADAHEDAFDADELAAETRGTCAVCHQTSSFSEIPPPGFDHEHWTGFAILGAHQEGECAACHAPSPSPDETGRRFGRVEQRFGVFAGCVTCHEDIHEGIFDRPDLPAQVDGRTDCARCHEETSFRSLPEGFDHGLWTGFALIEDHAEASCSGCHEPTYGRAALERTWRPAAGAGCADCHIDPHAGQFAAQGWTDCSRCHAAERQAYLAFEHDRDSRFRLGEQHRALDCDACHKVYPGTGGFDVVRYRPLGTECVDCHGMNEDVLMRRKRRGGG